MSGMEDIFISGMEDDEGAFGEMDNVGHPNNRAAREAAKKSLGAQQVHRPFSAPCDVFDDDAAFDTPLPPAVAAAAASSPQPSSAE